MAPGENIRICVMKTQCPHCKANFNTSEKNVGKQAKCPKCGKRFSIAPYVQAPRSVGPAAQAPKPTETRVTKTEPVVPPAKSTEPVKPPAPIAPPVKSPEVAGPSAKSVAPAETSAKISARVAPAAEIAEPVEEEKPKSTALSKTVFVYCWIAVRVIAGMLGFLGLMLAIRESARSTLIATFMVADVFWICSVLIELMLFYKMWAAIQDGQVSVSPAKAVAFLFIPVFNVYWTLLMLNGFAEDYNAFIHRRSVQAEELPPVLFLVYAFLFILFEMVMTVLMLSVFAFVELIGRAFTGFAVLSWAIFLFISAAGIGHFITYILVATKTCGAVNALPGRKGM